jgi:hypothetical protein
MITMVSFFALLENGTIIVSFHTNLIQQILYLKQIKLHITTMTAKIITYQIK